MDTARLTRRAKLAFTTSAAGLLVLGAALPAAAQDGSADLQLELEGVDRAEALERLGVKGDLSEFDGPIERLIPSRDGSIDTPYEREAAEALRNPGRPPGDSAAAQAQASAGTDVGTEAGAAVHVGTSAQPDADQGDAEQGGGDQDGPSGILELLGLDLSGLL